MSKRLSNVFSIYVSPVYICVYLNILTPVYISLYPELLYICVYPDNLYIFVYITVLSYKQNNFGCFLKELEFCFFKTPKIGLLIFQKPNVAQRLFCIQNERHDILYDFIYKDHRCSLFMSWVIKQQRKLYFENVGKTPNFGRVVHTQIRVRLFIFC